VWTGSSAFNHHVGRFRETFGDIMVGGLHGVDRRERCVANARTNKLLFAEARRAADAPRRVKGRVLRV
jgi:hypothetical protein